MIYVSQYAVYDDCRFVLREYEVNGAISLEVWSDEEGPVVCITVNVKAVSLGPDEVIVKDYSENQGVADWMAENGYASYTGEAVSVGYVACPIMKLDMKKIKENM